ncbi:hypothetical protein ACFQX4_25390 [Roseomonas sp. GCM10028921]
MIQRDVVVIGGSLGSTAVFKRLLGGLPAGRRLPRTGILPWN